MPTKADWERLGKMLIHRRVELDSRYYSRPVFARERGLEYRLVGAIERGERDNYKPQSIARFEMAYELVPGAIDFFLASGGELAAAKPGEPEPDLYGDDPQLGRLVHLWHRMDDRQRAIVMAVAEATAAPQPERRYGT